MSGSKRRIEPADVLPIADYERERAERRRTMAALKRHRRVEVGPFATCYFESYATMLHQVHEMLFIERGGDPQLADELAAYNPLIPQGDELVATVMFEIDDPDHRQTVLSQLGGIEGMISLAFADETVTGAPEGDVDRTTAAGKTSAVHFLHFRFTPAQIAKFRMPGTPVIVGIRHPRYGHLAVMPEEVRAALAEDFA